MIKKKNVHTGAKAGTGQALNAHERIPSRPVPVLERRREVPLGGIGLFCVVVYREEKPERHEGLLGSASVTSGCSKKAWPYTVQIPALGHVLDSWTFQVQSREPSKQLVYINNPLSAEDIISFL